MPIPARMHRLSPTTRTESNPERPARSERDLPARPPAPGSPAPEAPERWFRREAGESPLECDRRWLGTVYRGDLPQLTSRAVLTGVVLGSVLAISNLYVGLKAGWALSVSITAIGALPEASAITRSGAAWPDAPVFGIRFDGPRGIDYLDRHRCRTHPAVVVGDVQDDRVGTGRGVGMICGDEPLDYARTVDEPVE